MQVVKFLNELEMNVILSRPLNFSYFKENSNSKRLKMLTWTKYSLIAMKELSQKIIQYLSMALPYS